MKEIKIILADKKVQNIKKILNNIINKRNNFKTYVATTEEELKDILSKNEIMGILVSKNFNINIKEIYVPIFYRIEDEIQYKKIDQALIEIEKKTKKDIKSYNVINKQLLLLGYNFKQKGSKYLCESIEYIYKSENLELVDNLEKNVYKYIAIKNNKTLINIKTNIIKATEYVYNNQDKEFLYKYFSINNKITPKLVISTILNKMIFLE